MDAIRTERLAKSYAGLRTTTAALKGLDLEVSPGEIFGYLGPNGAGKTTTLKLLMGLMRPTSGQAWVFGRPIGDPLARRDAGFMPEQPHFPPHLTCEELLVLCGRLSGLGRRAARRRAGRLLEHAGLATAARKRLRWLSKGMLQWLGLAQALVGKPQILILDEPMSGLDPIGRRRMRNLILEEKTRGTTVFFSSHILADVEMICDRVGILRNGELVQCGRLSDIRDRHCEGAEIRVRDLPRECAGRIRELGAGLRYFGDETLIELLDGDRLTGVLQRVLEAGGRVQTVSPRRESLEDYFLRQVRSAESRTGGPREAHVRAPERKLRRGADSGPRAKPVRVKQAEETVESSRE